MLSIIDVIDRIEYYSTTVQFYTRDDINFGQPLMLLVGDRELILPGK